MNIRILSTEQITAYDTYLRIEERAAGTREKYLRDVQAFVCWLNGAAVTKEAVTSWKERLLAEHRAPSTVNAALSALNGLFRFLGWEDCRTRFVRVQRRLFRDPARELTRPDYDRLIAAARELGRDRLALVMEAICSTGVRGKRDPLSHRGSRSAGPGGNFSERESPYHSYSHQAGPETLEVRQEK